VGVAGISMLKVSMVLMRTGFTSPARALTGARLLKAALAPAATLAEVNRSLRFI
jgi:hypothetical protein